MLNRFYSWFRERTSRPEERGESSAGYWPDIVRYTVLDLIKQETGNILEVGCGEGLFIARLTKTNQDLNIFGMDKRNEILLKARDRLKDSRINDVHLIQADACAIPFRGNYFNTIICVNTFYNMPSDEIFRNSLREITRVCRKGGRVFFDIRNSMNPLINMKYKLAKYYDDTISLITHNLNRVTAYLEEGDLEITNRINIGFPKNIFSPIFILETKKRQ